MIKKQSSNKDIVNTNNFINKEYKILEGKIYVGKFFTIIHGDVLRTF